MSVTPTFLRAAGAVTPGPRDGCLWTECAKERGEASPTTSVESRSFTVLQIAKHCSDTCHHHDRQNPPQCPGREKPPKQDLGAEGDGEQTE